MSIEPAWLKRFAERICEAMEFPESNSPIGCHYHLDETVWEVTVFASATEIVGGPDDGNRVPSGFICNLELLMRAFGCIHELSWQAARIGPDDELGTHLAVRGEFEGHAVWLRLLATAPERYSPGRIFNHHTGEMATTW